MSKKTKGKNAFTSLSINRVAQEEIQKYNNNAIHLTYSPTENNNLKNNRFPKRPNQTKYSNGSSEINIIRNTTYQTNNKNNSPNKKDKNNYIENPNYSIQPIKKNKSGIVINIYSRKNDNDKEDIIVNEDNYCYDNDNQTEKDEYENLGNNKNNFNVLDAVELVRNMWIKTNKIINGANIVINNNCKIKKINNKIIKEINFKIMPINKWGKELKKKIENFFTIYKTSSINRFIYTEANYIKDLSNSIFLPKNNENDLYITNPPNSFQTLNKINYKLIKPKDQNQLESELFEYYIQNKKNYYANIDNNDDTEEQKLKPINVLSKPQIRELYDELNLDKEKKRDWGIDKNSLTIVRQVNLDYEVMEIFTPRVNIDNNTNRTKYNDNFIDTNRKNENSIKNNSQDFGQYTPISMLNDKFFVYAITRNIKYSVPESQGFINYLNYDKYVKRDFGNDKLQKNKFSLKIAKINKNENNNKKKNNNNNNSVIDYSKYSSGSDRNSKNK